MIEFMNFVRMTSPNFASGMTSRFSALWRRDIVRLRRISFGCSKATIVKCADYLNLESLACCKFTPSSFRPLGAVFGTALLAVLDALGVEHAAQNVIAHARQVLHPAAADHDDRMLLQIMTLARDIADHLETIGQADLGNLAQRRIRLFRGCRIDPRADAPLLRAGAEMARLFAIGLFLPRLADQLTDRGHPWSFSIFPINHGRAGPARR